MRKALRYAYGMAIVLIGTYLSAAFVEWSWFPFVSISNSDRSGILLMVLLLALLPFAAITMYPHTDNGEKS